MAKKKDDVPSLLEQISGLGPTRLGRNDPNSAANTMPSLNKIGQMGEPSFEEDPTIEKSQHKIYVERLGEQRRFARPSEQYEEKYATLQVIEKSIRGLKLDIKQIYNTTSSPFAGQPGAERLHAEYIDKLQTGIKVGEDERDRIKADLIARDARNVTRFHEEIGTHMQGEWSPSKLGGEEKRLRASDPNIHMAALPYASQDWGVLQERKREIEKTQRYREQEALSEVQQETIGTKEIGMGPINVTQLTQHATTRDVAYADRNRLVKETAIINAALAMKKHRGEDPESMMSEMIRREEGIQGIVNRADMAKQLQETRGVSIKSTSIDPELFGKEQKVATSDINTELITQSKLYLEAMKGLTETTAKINDLFGETDNALEAMQENFKAVAQTSGENVEALQKAQQAGGSRNSPATRSQWASALAGGFGAAGGAIEQILVTQRLGQMANITNFANIENQKYSMYQRARQGDVLSQMMLPQWEKAEQFGKELKVGQNIALGAQAVGAVAQTAAGSFQISEALVQKNPVTLAGAGITGNLGAATNELIQGVLNAVQGVANASVIGVDLVRQVSAQAVQAQGTQAYMAAREALAAVPAAQLQQFRDLSVGAGTAAMGMGGARGEAFLNRTVNQDLTATNTMEQAVGLPRTRSFMERMTEARMSPAQWAEAAQLGQQQMGNLFNENLPLTSKNLQYAGFGTMQENQQRMGMLTQAGGNNPQTNLAAVLEAAVSKGVSSSTAMTQLVENTAATAQSSIARTAGIDVTEAAAQLIGSTINQADKGDIYAVRRAGTVDERMSETDREQGMSYVTALTMNQSMQQTGIGYQEAQSVPTFDTASMKAFYSQLVGPNKANAIEAVRGLRDIGYTDVVPGVDDPNAVPAASKFIEGLLKTRAEAELRGGSKGAPFTIGVMPGIHKMIEDLSKDPVNINKNVDKMINRYETGDFESPEDKELLTQIGRGARAQGVTTTNLLKRVGGILAPETQPDPNSKVQEGLEGRNILPTTKAVFEMTDSGFKQLSESALAATKTLGSAVETLKTLSELSKKYEEGALEREETAAAAAEKVSGGMDFNTKQFNASVTKFDGAIDKLVTQLGGKTASIDWSLDSTRPNLNTPRSIGGTV